VNLSCLKEKQSHLCLLLQWFFAIFFTSWLSNSTMQPSTRGCQRFICILECSIIGWSTLMNYCRYCFTHPEDTDTPQNPSINVSLYYNYHDFFTIKYFINIETTSEFGFQKPITSGIPASRINHRSDAQGTVQSL